MLVGTKVTKNFGGLMAVNEADFQVDQGEVVGLIGPNGAGKTTLFNLISGALPANSGTITFNGQDITNLPVHQICKKGIARTFQSTKLFANLTVVENVSLAALFGTSDKAAHDQVAEEVEELLDFVGLADLGSAPASALPIAKQRRLEIARALATNPDLVLFDEVMAGLNPTEVADSMALIGQIRERGTTIFMIEHVMKAIMSVCDRILVFHNGRKLAEGIPAEIAMNPEVIEIYLGE